MFTKLHKLAPKLNSFLFREAAKKVLFLVDMSTKRGGGGKGLSTKEKVPNVH